VGPKTGGVHQGGDRNVFQGKSCRPIVNGRNGQERIL